jgi:uncharacterized delta-60 repeat protein
MRSRLKRSHLLALFLLLNTEFAQATLDVSASNANGVGIRSNGSIIAVGSITVNGLPQLLLARYTQFGMIDTTYGYNGYVATPIGTNAIANGLVIQNNQVVIAGFAQPPAGATFAIARYNHDGTLDDTFNATGIVTKLIGTGADAYNIVVDSSGKYIIAGVSIISGAPIVTVVRYNTDGTIDTSFGSSGIATKRIFSSAGAYDVALQSSGKIVTAGFTVNAGIREFALMRFNTDGSLDTTFNGSGTIATAIGHDSCAYAVAIQTNNRIIAAGVSNNQFALARYINGSLDTSFGSSGIVTTTIGSSAQINDVVLQSNGKIIAVGFADNQFALARYNTNGTLDTTFGSGGIVTTSIGTTANANSIALQNNGQIIVAGNSDTGVIIVRYNTDGSIDTSFGANGIINFPDSNNAPDIFGISDINIANDAGIQYTKLNLENSIMDSDISVNAAIANSKLAPLASPGTVLNTATTATSFNVPGAIIARDTLGNFTANTIYSNLVGNVIGGASDNLLKSGDTMSGVLVLPSGTAVAPSLQFSGCKKTGLSADLDILGISTKGLERVTIDGNGSVTINVPNSGTALTVNGDTLIAGDISNAGNSVFNTDSLSLNSVGTTQGPLTKMYGGVGNTGLEGSTIIDYTAAGFSNAPIICMNPVNGISVLLTIKSITNTSATIMSGSILNVPFNYIALGI